MASESVPNTENEAIHYKTLAESSFNSGDFISALNHARKALSLSPNTQGTSSMVTALQIITSSAVDSPEWYNILQVEPFSPMDIIKQQYRKLALVLHPDKNPYTGCEEGFKLVNEAFRVLSDVVERAEYDTKLRVRIQGEIGNVGFCGGDDEMLSFKTVCSSCGFVQKFDRKFLGQNLMCRSCKKSFEAKEEDGASTSKIITYSRRKKRASENGESLRKESETMEIREEGEALSVSEKLDEEDEGMMTLAEMQLAIKRRKTKIKSKITEKSSGDVSISTKKVKNKKNTKLKTANHQELTEIVDLEYVPRVDRKRDRGTLIEKLYLEDEDFDFDKDRMPRSFKKGQVWAISDGSDDKMARSYCLISEVISLNPFKVWISWLNFDSEKLISWMKTSSSHVPCGRFRVSDKAYMEQVKPFSHIVDCERAGLEVYQIYPRKGSVWAVYAETNQGHQRRKSRRYEIVVCLTMYSDAYGLSVAYLEKVSECSDLFKRRDYGYNAVRWVEKDDVAALLSHQIPAKKLSEDECGTGLKESWVLDLTSVPPNLVLDT